MRDQIKELKAIIETDNTGTEPPAAESSGTETAPADTAGTEPPPPNPPADTGSQHSGGKGQ